MRRLLVLVGADCDPDRPDYGGYAYAEERGLSWRGVEAAALLAAEASLDVGAPTGRSVTFPVTWCIRSDYQMHHVYGDYSWCYAHYEDIWTELANAGHELAWHPHLWRWDSSSSCWYQETADATWIEETLTRGYTDLCAHGLAVPAVRAGWNYQSNLTMRICDELRLRVDFSALPGEACPGYKDDRGSRFHGAFDWTATPTRPYRPNRSDYRAPADSPEACLRILEVPLTTVRSLPLNAVVAARNLIRRGSLVWPQRHAFRITAHPRLFRTCIEQALRDHNQFETALLGAYFHPDELLAQPETRTPLYSAPYLRRNLETVLAVCDRRGVEVVPVTASQVAPYFQ